MPSRRRGQGRKLEQAIDFSSSVCYAQIVADRPHPSKTWLYRLHVRTAVLGGASVNIHVRTIRPQHLQNRRWSHRSLRGSVRRHSGKEESSSHTLSDVVVFNDV